MEQKNKMSKRDKAMIFLFICLLLGFAIQTVYVFKLSNKVSAQQGIHGKFAKDISPLMSFSRQRHQRKNNYDNNWNPFEEMELMQQNMNRMFSNSLWRGGLDSGFNNVKSLDSFFEPDVDIQEKKDHYLLRLDIPGMEKDKIELAINNGYITISGERDSEKQEKSEDGKFFRAERSFGRFNRSIPLPGEIKDEDVVAEYKNGVLEIVLPKVNLEMEKEESSKKIAIS